MVGHSSLDLDRYSIPVQCRLPMSEHDIKTGRELLEEDFIQKNPAWIEELELMVKTKEKAEIQALSAYGFEYLSAGLFATQIATSEHSDKHATRAGKGERLERSLTVLCCCVCCSEEDWI